MIELIRLALAEDLGERGDVTATATVPAGATTTASFVAREAGVVAGLGVLAAVCAEVDPSLLCTASVGDGARVRAGECLASVAGPTRALLVAERTALNFLTHLSGVATAAARYCEVVAGTGCTVRDTRKTLPGLRALQKAAVAAGGAANHRMGLYDGLLVKDNHAVAAGGVARATAAALSGAGDLEVQVEVDDLGELDAALQAGATCVLLDNFGLEDLRAAVDRCRPRGVFTEASGGVTLQTVRAIAETGVEAVAVGALTHSVQALDIGLDFEEVA
ncbi:MAG: carboxylating nicotinate-nucleotide diphosphorylase [Actinomycetota bacterium]|nr:carboxylating nicotinate-nucleotide diphosphorylase [Actinomycetota bacterium]